ncbi:hypothetical protein JTB14_031031 [Gonioctena quinquepunctata]|nr:hypothetical protein JTB14_031031 [Gonioctena quinquepunctata]
MARENGNHEKQSITSKGTRTTSTSLVRRRNIQAELEAHRKLAEIAKKELEIEKNLIQKELELNRLAELDDIQKGVESVVLEDFSNIKENISEDTSRRRRVKYDEIQQWVDTAPSDNSFNCDFRSIDERPVVNNDVMSRCHYFDTNRRGMNHFMARQSEVREKEVLLRVAPVVLRGPKRDYSTYALFDEASTVTLLSDDLAKTIGLQGTTDPLKIDGPTL